MKELGLRVATVIGEFLRGRHGVPVEFLRYFIASGGALGVDVGLYQLGLRLGWGYSAAAIVGFCAGAVVAYGASIAWVFEVRRVRSPGLEFILFVAVGVAGLLLTELLLWVQITQFSISPTCSKIGAAAVVFIFNFAVRRTALFRAPKNAAAAGVACPSSS